MMFTFKTTIVFVCVSLFLTSCLTSMPADRDPRQLSIEWSKTFEEAQQKAKKENKPLLVIYAAGDLTKEC